MLRYDEDMDSWVMRLYVIGGMGILFVDVGRDMGKFVVVILECGVDGIGEVVLVVEGVYVLDGIVEVFLWYMG